MLKLFLKFSYGSVLSAAISLFTTPVVTALISPEDFGKASMFTLAYNLILQFFLLGLDQSFVREFYKDNSASYQRGVLFNSLYASLLFSIPAAIIVLLFKSFVSRQILGFESDKIVWVLVISLILGVIERFSVLFIRMKQQASKYSFIKLLGSVITFLVTYLYALHIKSDFYSIIYANLAALSLGAGLAIALSFSSWRLTSFNWNMIKSMLHYGLPFVATFMASWLFEGIDKIMLRNYASYHELGVFSASFKFVAILSIVQLAFSAFWIPVSMELYEKSSKEAALKFSNTFSLVSSALFIGSAGIILCKDLIMLLFDKKYMEASSIMPFLLLIPVMYTLSEITVGGINFSKKTYWHLVISISVAIVNILLTFLLIPLYGAKGAALSTGISYIVFFVLRTLISGRYFPLSLKKKKIILPTFVFFTTAFINTFYESRYDYLVNIISLSIMFFVFRYEISILILKIKSKFQIR